MKLTNKIYLAGGMTGIPLEEQLKWRENITNKIKLMADNTLEVFNPPKYYSPKTKNHETEREVMDYELHTLKQCGLVIVNYNIPDSIGTAMELAIAKEFKIPVVAYLEDTNKLHPWLQEVPLRIFNNWDLLAEYVVHYFLM